jgi:hypothetical protein
MGKRTRGLIYEIISEVILITSTIYLSTLFANDSVFNSRIEERPTLFAYVAFGGIILTVGLRLLSKKYEKETD